MASSHCLKVNLDFTNWFQNQDESLTHGIASETDRIFGLKGVYTSVHQVPMRSFCLFQDRDCIPEQDPKTGLPILGPRCVYGLNSLGEGMNQKLWTLITSSLILYYTKGSSSEIDSIGSGDNQLLLLKIDDGVQEEDLYKSVQQRLNALSDDTGLKLKMEETYGSVAFVEYGKTPFIKGASV